MSRPEFLNLTELVQYELKIYTFNAATFSLWDVNNMENVHRSTHTMQQLYN